MSKSNFLSDKTSVLLLPAGSMMLLTLVLLFGLQHAQEFIYYYREQQQLFIFDSDYAASLLSRGGGLSVIVGQLIVQFFVLPHFGAVLTTLLSLLSAVFVFLTLRGISSPSRWMAPLCFLPTLLYNVCLTDAYVHYDGLVAMLLATLFVALYARLPVRAWIGRLIAGSVGVLVLYRLIGSVVLLAAICLFLFDALRKAPRVLLSIVPAALVLLAGWVGVQRGEIIDFANAFGPQFYCEYYFTPTLPNVLSWVSWPLLLLLAAFSRRIRLPRERLRVEAALAVAFVLLLSLTFIQLSDRQANPAYYALQKEMHYATVGDWDRLLSTPGISAANDLQMNYFNLALENQGRLLTDLFAYPQRGAESVVMAPEEFTDVSALMAHLYYRMGNIGAAQNMAFSTTVGVTYGNPSMTQLLVKTYLVNGNYRLAEKNLARLEKTLFYAAWAKKYRRFLFDDAAVEADSELGMLRSCLPDNDSFTMLFGNVADLVTVLRANPSYQPAADYAIALLLLSKDFNNIRAFVEEFGGRGCLAKLPERLQEAVLTYAENDLDYCRAHGVDETTIERFARFRQKALTLRKSGANTSGLAAEWGKTFWYYVIKS